MPEPVTNSDPGLPDRRISRPGAARSLLVLVYLVVAVGYLAWRPYSFNPDALLFSSLVYAAELFGFVCAVLFLFMCWRLKQRTPPPVPEGMTADVFVPTLNESVQILRRTLLAALRMDHVGEVWLLDDGARAEMRDLARQLGCRYVARTDNADAKAGNLNNALRLCNADYIALFDADHAPTRQFLSQTLGFLTDPAVAFVQTPHEFYNLDSFQNRVDRPHSNVWSEQLLFFRVIQPGKDRLNSAFFCGSCAVVRREAIEEIGGFATGTVTEDIHTSLKLHKQGWRSVYYARALAFGIAPSTATAFLKQRLRWGQGAMQTWRREGLITAKGLSWSQRLSYLGTVLTYFEGWQRVILFLAPVIVLTTGIMPIAAVDAEFLIRFLPYFILNYWVFEEIGRGYGRSVLTEQYTMTRFAIFIAATFGYFLRKLRFNVTSKKMGETDLVNRIFWPQMLVFALNAAAIPLGIALYFHGSPLPMGGLLANLIWASLTAWIAFLAIGNAFRVARYRRREYRFPLSLPFRIESEGAERVALISDISPAGCRMSGVDTTGYRIGDVIKGTLLLPSGGVAVQAAVRSKTERSPKHGQQQPFVGCEFLWASADQQIQLELFLYGSDLQWQFNGFTDRMPTLLERFGRFLRRGHRRSPTDLPRRWIPLLYRRPDSGQASGVGFISAPDPDVPTRVLVAPDRFPEGFWVSAEEITSEGPRGVQGLLAAESGPLATLAPMNLYRWTT